MIGIEIGRGRQSSCSCSWWWRLVLVLYLVPIPLWIAAWASGAYVGLLTLIGMRLRRVPPSTVVDGADQRGEGRARHLDQRPGGPLSWRAATW